MPQVLIAERYNPTELGSLGHATYMLICQNKFPLDYEVTDHKTSADHDRLLMWDYEHFRMTCKEYLGTGELGIPAWAQSQHPEKVLEFIKAAMKADPKIKWTGHRILGTVNRSNGYPVYSLELFAKGKGSKTKVYTGENAPNVKGYGKTRVYHNYGGYFEVDA